jgi:cell division protease FtsH
MEKRPKGSYKPVWRSNYVVLLLVGLLVFVAIHSLIFSSPREELPYSQFKSEILADRISDVKVGPSQITGKWEKSPGQTLAFYTPRRGLEQTDQSLPLVLEENGVTYSGETEPSGLQTLLLYVVTIAAMFGLFLLMMRRLGGGSAMAFARSRAQVYSQDDVDITFSDVAGIDEAVEELREVVDFLKCPEKYQSLGGRIPKGVLLVGPPGTGKTLLSRAVAGEAGVPFFSLSGSDFVEMFVGVGAARVRDLFQQAEQKAPCIVFIDELDALGKTRGGVPVGSHDEREQTLNQLLVEMDGFDSDRGVIIMAATNRPETLDAALLRAGRFDRNVVVDRPDINGREAILKVHARSIKLAAEVDLRAVAALTPGFVGADLASLVNEAALLAARGGKTQVGRAEFENGIERVVAGLEKKRRVMLPEERRRIAVHEAGHAIVAAVLPGTDPVHKISIIPRGLAALGYTLQRPQDDRYLATKSQLLTEIQVLLGGLVAEQLLAGEISSGATNDLERATGIASRMVKNYGMSDRLGPVSYQENGTAFLPAVASRAREHNYSEQTAREIDEEIRRILDDSLARVHTLLARRRPALEDLAARLLAKEVIEAGELAEVLERFPEVTDDQRRERPAPASGP